MGFHFITFSKFPINVFFLLYLWWNFVLKWQTFIFCYWETKSILITAAFYFLFFVKCWGTKNILYFSMQFAIRCCILGSLNCDSRRPASPPWWGLFLVSFFLKFWSAYSFVSADGELLLSYDKLFFYYWETNVFVSLWYLLSSISLVKHFFDLLIMFIMQLEFVFSVNVTIWK